MVFLAIWTIWGCGELKLRRWDVIVVLISFGVMFLISIYMVVSIGIKMGLK